MSLVWCFCLVALMVVVVVESWKNLEESEDVESVDPEQLREQVQDVPDRVLDESTLPRLRHRL